MNRFLKSALAAVLIAILAVSSFAAGSLVTISVDPSIKILVNGKVFQPKDANGNDVMTFTYNGTTYAPLRAMAEAFGLEVGYDSAQRMATVGEHKAVNPNLVSSSLYLHDTLQTHYNSGFSYTPSYEISDADYKLYNDIMDYLYSDMSKSEDVLFAELSLIYDTPAEELHQFVRNNMSAAVNRKVGNTSTGETVPDSNIIECAKTVMWETLKNYLYFSDSPDDWTVTSTGLKYVINTNFGLRPDTFTEHAVIKIEFSENYKTFDLYQLKYNGKNIDLN